MAAPGVGTAVGTAAGLALGAAADYFLNKRREKKNRANFIKTNSEALDLTISQWKSKLHDNVGSAVDRWFEDARAGMVLSRPKGGAQLPKDAPSKHANAVNIEIFLSLASSHCNF